MRKERDRDRRKEERSKESHRERRRRWTDEEIDIGGGCCCFSIRLLRKHLVLMKLVYQNDSPFFSLKIFSKIF